MIYPHTIKPGFDDLLHVAQVGEHEFSLTRPLRFQVPAEDVDIKIPSGFITDFATVPWILAWLVPRYGRYTRSAVLHDHSITTGLPWGTSLFLMDLAMKHENVRPWRRIIIRGAVRVWGWARRIKKWV